MIRKFALLAALARCRESVAGARLRPADARTATALGRRVRRPRPTSRCAGCASASPAAGGARSPGATFGLGVDHPRVGSRCKLKSGDPARRTRVVMMRVGGGITADRSDGNYKSRVVNLCRHVVMHDSTGDYGGHGKGQQSGPSTLTADKAEIDSKAKEYKATGSVLRVGRYERHRGDRHPQRRDARSLLARQRTWCGPRRRRRTVHYNTVTGRRTPRAEQRHDTNWPVQPRSPTPKPTIPGSVTKPVGAPSTAPAAAPNPRNQPRRRRNDEVAYLTTHATGALARASATLESTRAEHPRAGAPRASERCGSSINPGPRCRQTTLASNRAFDQRAFTALRRGAALGSAARSPRHDASALARSTVLFVDEIHRFTKASKRGATILEDGTIVDRRRPKTRRSK